MENKAYFSIQSEEVHAPDATWTATGAMTNVSVVSSYPYRSPLKSTFCPVKIEKVPVKIPIFPATMSTFSADGKLQRWLPSFVLGLVNFSPHNNNTVYTVKDSIQNSNRHHFIDVVFYVAPSKQNTLTVQLNLYINFWKLFQTWETSHR